MSAWDATMVHVRLTKTHCAQTGPAIAACYLADA